jgi:hypothetical protein
VCPGTTIEQTKEKCYPLGAIYNSVSPIIPEQTKERCYPLRAIYNSISPTIPEVFEVQTFHCVRQIQELYIQQNIKKGKKCPKSPKA